MLTKAEKSASGTVKEREEAILSEVYNESLEKSIKYLQDNGKLKKGDSAVELIKKATEENVADFSKHPLCYLHGILKKKGYRLNLSEKHVIMLHAIKNKASLQVFRYLCKKKMYDSHHMKKGKRFQIITKMEASRILQEIQNKSFFPKLPKGRLKTFCERIYTFILSVRTIVMIYRAFQLILRGFRSDAFTRFLIGHTDNFETKYKVLNICLRWLDFSFSLTFILLVFFLKTLMVLGNHALLEGTEPTYLVLLLLSDRDNEEKEAIVACFFEEGADPTVRCLFLTKEKLEGKDYQTSVMLANHEFMTFQYVSPIHIATQIGSLKLVKAFQARGANLQQYAITLKDKIDLKAKPPAVDMVTLQDLSIMKSKGKTMYDGLLDFVDPSKDKELYDYLIKTGLKKKEEKKKKEEGKEEKLK
ncbi:MAG: hypothetical protein AAF335_04210 [Bacteroidota bacterium]